MLQVPGGRTRELLQQIEVANRHQDASARKPCLAERNTLCSHILSAPGDMPLPIFRVTRACALVRTCLALAVQGIASDSDALRAALNALELEGVEVPRPVLR